ncbi:MAG: type I-F CRISPR-associated endoribonuclease Cas6/Csy4, partial [Pseudomonadota bacterium]
LVQHGFDSGQSATLKNGEIKSLKKSNVGLSIPEYVKPEKGKNLFPLGTIIRLFAKSAEELEQLNLIQWLLRYEDYAQVKSIKPVPDNTKHAYFFRVRKKGKVRIEKKTRQMAASKADETGEPLEKWLQHFSATAPSGEDEMPYVTSFSLSGGQSPSSGFPLFIDMRVIDFPVEGSFNGYGLNNNVDKVKATVPWFI